MTQHICMTSKQKKLEHLFLLTQLSSVDSDLTIKLENIFPILRL